MSAYMTVLYGGILYTYFNGVDSIIWATSILSTLGLYDGIVNLEADKGESLEGIVQKNHQNL